MGLFDIFRRPQSYEIEAEIAKNDSKIINVDGFEINSTTGELLHAPRGLEVYNIPEQVKSVSKMIGMDIAESAVEVNFHPNSTIVRLPEYLFVQCWKLKKVQLPDTMKNIEKLFSFDQINRGLVFNIPEQIEEISNYSIPAYLEKMVLGNQFKRVIGTLIGHHAYLKYLEIPGTIENKKVPDFYQLQALETLVIREGLTTMDTYNRHGFNSLTNIYLPHSLQNFFLDWDDSRGIEVAGSVHCCYNDKLKNRKLKIYKTINDQQIIFEVKREGFKEISFTDSMVIFNGSFKIPLDELTMNSHYIIDIASKKFEKIADINTIIQEKKETIMIETQDNVIEYSLNGLSKEQLEELKKAAMGTDEYTPAEKHNSLN